MNLSRKAVRRRTNPFYPLLVAAGMVFAITACAYGVLTVKQLRHFEAAAEVTQRDQRFLQLMDRYGTSLLIGELLVLAIFSVAAMALDPYYESQQTPANSKHGEVPRS